jgi:2-iminobutanoate/2-iminopropanoate deaminase
MKVSAPADAVSGGAPRADDSDPGGRTPETDHPYSPAYVAGDFIFVSGALSVGPGGEVPVEGRREALDAALARLRERLATAGVDLVNVVKATYYVTDITLRTEANTQCLEVFADPRPARTFIEVSRLPYGATVEIEAVARRDPSGVPARGQARGGSR